MYKLTYQNMTKPRFFDTEEACKTWIRKYIGYIFKHFPSSLKIHKPFGEMENIDILNLLERIDKYEVKNISPVVSGFTWIGNHCLMQYEDKTNLNSFLKLADTWYRYPPPYEEVEDYTLESKNAEK